MIDDLKDIVKEKFPKVENVWFSEDSIMVKTKHFKMELYKWNDLKDLKPTVRYADDNFDEDEDERNQCMTAFNWIFFRYDIGYIEYHRVFGKD